MMSWERKWKEFQTADRIDEAPKKKSDVLTGSSLGAIGAKIQKQGKKASDYDFVFTSIGPMAYPKGTYKGKSPIRNDQVSAAQLNSRSIGDRSTYFTDDDLPAPAAPAAATSAPSGENAPEERPIRATPPSSAKLKKDAAAKKADAAPEPTAEKKPKTKTLTGKELGFSSNAKKIYSSDGKGGFYRQDTADGKKTKMSSTQVKHIETALKNKNLSFGADSSTVEPVSNRPVVAAAPEKTEPAPAVVQGGGKELEFVGPGPRVDPETGLASIPNPLPAVKSGEKKNKTAATEPAAVVAKNEPASQIGWSKGNENLLKNLRAKKENSKLTRQEKRQFKVLKYGEKMNNLEKIHQSGEMISDRDFKKLKQYRNTQRLTLDNPNAQAADNLAAAMKPITVDEPEEMEDFTKKTPPTTPTTPPKADDDDDDGISAGTTQNALDNLGIPDRKVDEQFARWRKELARKTPKKKVVKESISHEKKWKNYKRIVESTGGGHLSPNKFQQDMKSRRARNDVYTSPSGHKNTNAGSPFAGKVNSFGKSNTYFENMNEAEQEVLDSFELQNELNPASFSGDKMIPEIRERLMEIAQDFLDGIDFKMDVEDITLTGSLANYNWSKYSDFDLHILVDYAAIDADQDLVKRFFQDIKAIWNIRHNIFLKGYEVEVYVQNTNEDHMSSGVYSVQNDEWVLKPEKEETERDPVDKQNIEKKADDIIFQIDRAEKLLADGKLDDALAAIDRLKQKVRNLRKIGLSKEDGVYSVENLAFKTLRRSMELERLSTLKNKAYDRQMSITQ